MRALLTDEHELLRDTVASIAGAPPSPVPEPGQSLPTDAWSTLAETGFTAIATSGRDGLTSMDVAIVCEQLGYGASPLPYIGCCVLPTAVLSAAGGDDALLDEIAGGRRLAVALDADLATISRDAPGIAVDAAGASDALLAVGGGAAIAPIGTTPRRGIDLTRVCFDVPLRPTTTVPLANPDPLFRPRGEWRTLATVALCADMVGTMAAAHDRAVSYARERRQFGRPIGSFQAIQHLCAEQHVRIEAARSALYYAAWAHDHLDEDAAWAAARSSKIFTADAARAVTEAAIQVHGGIGITWESDLHVFVRRATFDRSILGSPHALLREDAQRFSMRQSLYQ